MSVWTTSALESAGLSRIQWLEVKVLVSELLQVREEYVYLCAMDNMRMCLEAAEGVDTIFGLRGLHPAQQQASGSGP